MKLNHWHDVRDWYRAFLNAGTRADIVPLKYDWSACTRPSYCRL